jgi:hypothetical protein
VLPQFSRCPQSLLADIDQTPLQAIRRWNELPLPAAVIAIVIVIRGERIKTAESEASEVMAIVVAVKTSGREIAAGGEIALRAGKVAAGGSEIIRAGRPRKTRSAAGKSGAAARHCRTTAKSATAMGHSGAAATAHVAAAATAEPTTAAAAAMVLSHGRCRDRRRAQNRGGRNCHHVFAHDFKLPVHKNCARDQ